MSTPVQERDLGLGIDQFHPETKIASGGAVDIVNGIARATGSTVKRPGWRLAAGYLPVRATKYVESGGNIVLTLPTSLSLANLVSTPIVISGRTAQAGAVLGTTAASVYASSFTFNSGAGTITISHSGGSYTETSPEVDIYGLLATAGTAPTGLTADLTSSDSAWLPNLLTPYEAPGTKGLVCVRGGVPYITTAPTADTTLYPAAVASPAIGLTAGANIGPALYTSAPGTVPARGYITSADVSAFGNTTITSAVYNSGPGTTTYVLRLAAYSASASLASIIRPGTDYLTVSQASWASLNGEFPVTAVAAVDANHISVTVTNTANAAADAQHSDTGLSAVGAVLTDVLPATSAIPAPAGSQLNLSDTTLDAADFRLYASTTNCVVGPVATTYVVGSGVTIGTRRSGSVIPLTATTGLLRGDELVCSVDGLLRCVLGVNPNSNQSASVVVASGTAIATVGTTAGLRAGDTVLFYQCAQAFGEVTISALTSTTIAWPTTVPAGTYAAELAGHSVWLETPVVCGLATTYGINRRWAAIPCAYDSSLTAQPATPITNKPFQTPTDRGTTVSDYSAHFSAAAVNKSLYITDGINPVKKYDGQQMYDAGLPSAPPMLFALKQEATGGIVNPSPLYSIRLPLTTYSFSVDSGVASAFTAGQIIYFRDQVLGALLDGVIDGGATGSYVQIIPNATVSGGTTKIRFDPGFAVQFWPGNSSGTQFFGGASGGGGSGIVAGTTYYLGAEVAGTGGYYRYRVYANQADALAGNGSYIAFGNQSGYTQMMATGPANQINKIMPAYQMLPIMYTTVTSVDTTNNIVRVADPLTDMINRYTTGQGNFGWTGTTLGTTCAAVTVSYYSKLRMVDVNGNITVSAGMGAQDFTLRLGVPTQVTGLLGQFPLLQDRQLKRIEWEVYRTAATSGTPPYYLVASGAFDYTTSPHPVYISFVDTVQPSQLATTSGTGIGTTDPNSTLTSGNSSGPQFERPPLAKYAASIDSRLVLANYKSPHRMKIAFRRKAGAPILATGSFAPQFIIKKGTTAPVSTTVSTSQHVLTVTSNSSLSPVVIEQTNSGSTFTNVSSGATGNIVYNYDTNYDQDVVASSMYGWYVMGDATHFASPGMTFTATGGASNWTFSGGSAQAALMTNGQPVYATGESGGAVSFPEATTYYLALTGGANFSLYTTRIDALGGTSSNKILDNGATWSLAAGDASGFPQRSVSLTTFPVVMDPAISYPTSVSAVQEVAWNTIGGHAPTATSSVEQQLASRLAAAINGAGQAYSVSQGVAPFVFARAGNDVGYAELLIESYDPSAPFNFTYIPGNQDGNFNVYVNDQLYVPATNLTSISGTVVSQQQLFPSRISISYQNYPETHDNPYTTDPPLQTSDTVVDISPDDGQVITGVANFFGSSIATAAQQNQYLLVTKQRDVYLVDVASRAVNRLNAASHGGEFPRAISESYSAIAYADHAGIQAIRSSDAWTYYGQLLERFWKQKVVASLDTPDTPVGGHSPYHNLWRLAVPTTTPSANDGVLVYDHTREMAAVAYGALTGQGAWSRYEGLAVGAWATFAGNDYFAATDSGQVMAERRDGLATDYRDYPQQPINLDVRLRPLDGDIPGTRKKVSHVLVGFRSDISTSGTTVSTMVDNDGVWRACDDFKIVRTAQDTNLGDADPRTVQTVAFSAPYSKFEYISVRIQNAALDEPVEITELTVQVDPLTDHGVPQAAQTTKTTS